jgi:DnaJ-class molecular chaperone
MNKYDFATEYILEQCGSLHWWTLSKKWKRITAAHIARIVVDEAQSQLTKRPADTCPYCRGKGSVRHPNYGVSAVCPRCHGSGRAANASRSAAACQPKER